MIPDHQSSSPRRISITPAAGLVRIGLALGLALAALALLIACATAPQPVSVATAGPSLPAPTSKVSDEPDYQALAIQVCLTCTFQSIQAAVDAAAPGALIQVAEGLYPERLVLTKSVTLEGGWDVSFTQQSPRVQRSVIDAQRLGSAISLSATSANVDGFWIVGGDAAQGGGVHVSQAQLFLSRCVISDNVTSDPAEGLGGGLYVEGATARVYLDASELVSNSAHLGGAMYIGDSANVTATNNLIVANTADAGGGIYVADSAFGRVINNTIADNAVTAIASPGTGTFLANNIIVSHAIGVSLTVAGEDNTPTHNLFYANGLNYAGITGTADLIGDPLFADHYHLTPASPAIDQALGEVAPARDFDGEYRAELGPADIGADEAGVRSILPMTMSQFTPRSQDCVFALGIYPPSAIVTQTAAAQDVGACWMRLYLRWRSIEPIETTPRTYNWQSFDEQIAAVTKAGIQPLVTLSANPSWAAAYPGGPVTETQDVLDFLTVAAERYDGDGYLDAPGSPVADLWEIYNEPDNQSTYYAKYVDWGYWGTDPIGYAEFLKIARATLRSVNPKAQVAFGGIAHEGVSEPGTGAQVFNLDFPAQVFAYMQEHPGEHFDYFNFHFFPLFAFRYTQYGPDIVGKSNYFHNLMSSYEVDHPSIVTESGYWNDSDAPPPWTGSYEEQARYVVQLYSRVIAAEIKFSSWLLLYDLPVHDAQRGLSDVNGVPKPAYNAYKTAANRLREVRFERALTQSELGTSKAEGYLFTNLNDGHLIYVAWTTAGQQSWLRVSAPVVNISDKLSAQYPMSPTLSFFEPFPRFDAEDGNTDGVVAVQYGPSPIYVETQP